MHINMTFRPVKRSFWIVKLGKRMFKHIFIPFTKFYCSKWRFYRSYRHNVMLLKVVFSQIFLWAIYLYRGGVESGDDGRGGVKAARYTTGVCTRSLPHQIQLATSPTSNLHNLRYEHLKNSSFKQLWNAIFLKKIEEIPII